MIILLLVIGVCAASSAAVMIRLADAPALIVAAYRLGLATGVVVPLALLRHRTEILSIPGRRYVTLFTSGILLAFHFAFWISSLDHTSVASSVLLVSTNPIFVGLGTWLILREPVVRRLSVGTAVAFLGTAVVAWTDAGSGDAVLYGNLLAAAGAVAISAHLLIGRRQRATMSLLPYLAFVYGAATVTLFALAALAGHPFTGYDDRTWTMLVGLALFPQLFGHSVYNYALRRVSPTVVALVLLGEPIGSAVLAWAFLGEVPSPGIYLGGVVILLGIGLAIAPVRRRGDPAESAV